MLLLSPQFRHNLYIIFVYCTDVVTFVFLSFRSVIEPCRSIMCGVEIER